MLQLERMACCRAFKKIRFWNERKSAEIMTSKFAFPLETITEQSKWLFNWSDSKHNFFSISLPILVHTVEIRRTDDVNEVFFSFRTFWIRIWRFNVVETNQCIEIKQNSKNSDSENFFSRLWNCWLLKN